MLWGVLCVVDRVLLLEVPADLWSYVKNLSLLGYTKEGENNEATSLASDLWCTYSRMLYFQKALCMY